MATAMSERRKLMVESRHRGMSTVGLLRKRAVDDEEGDDRVTFVELFFDLVFVFSIVQLSHTLSLNEYSCIGIAQSSLMILAVWWEWIYTTWAMNWIHPESAPGRATLFSLSLSCLVESTAIPRAFGCRGWTFALAHVATQVGRSCAMVAMMKSDPRRRTNFLRITIWLCMAAPFWLYGAYRKKTRLLWWTIGLGVEYLGPVVGFWMPFGIGFTRAEEWDVLGGHMAERVASFVIICLGESLTVAGEILSRKRNPGLDVNLAFLVSFATSLSLWWTYFRFNHKQAAAHIELSDNPGHVARLVYTYFHIPIVAGIIFSAAATRSLLDDPYRPATPTIATANVGGPVLYLCGTLSSKTVISGHFMLSHVAGVAALIFVYFLLFFLSLTLLDLAGAVLIVLLLVAASEQYLEHKSSYERACHAVYSRHPRLQQSIPCQSTVDENHGHRDDPRDGRSSSSATTGSSTKNVATAEVADALNIV